MNTLSPQKFRLLQPRDPRLRGFKLAVMLGVLVVCLSINVHDGGDLKGTASILGVLGPFLLAL